jgi:hypothetical protein
VRRAGGIAIAAALVLGTACPGDRDPAPSGDGSSSTTAIDGASFVGLEPDLGAGSSTGPAWPLPTDDELLTCVRTCEGPWDCCPAGTEGVCPGPAYPFNHMCIDGLCAFPPCLGDADCPSAGEQCLPVRGAPRCVLPCTGDDVCTPLGAETTCSGQTDDGTAYCLQHCTTPGVFCGNQSCDDATGVCVCTSAGQCQADWACV